MYNIEQGIVHFWVNTLQVSHRLLSDEVLQIDPKLLGISLRRLFMFQNFILFKILISKFPNSNSSDKNKCVPSSSSQYFHSDDKHISYKMQSSFQSVKRKYKVQTGVLHSLNQLVQLFTQNASLQNHIKLERQEQYIVIYVYYNIFFNDNPTLQKLYDILGDTAYSQSHSQANSWAQG